ncbi:MAG: protein-glutamate O-methyltransferase CheR [Bacteroidota bacterium]|nr:protein-glutamate O-methyltransferase CheR [Bacteroidota bacterium]
MNKITTIKTEEREIRSLLDALYQNYGYDFRQYSEAHIKRRIRNRMTLSGLESISAVQQKAEQDKTFTSLLLQDLSITVTEMFRDSNFFKALREKVIPILKTYSFIKIWHAGCSTGEEAYSMAILLKEEGLFDRTTIYATDFNQHALDRAKEGFFSNSLIKDYTRNYQSAAGKESFSNYYTADHKMAIMNQALRDKIVWANHNLVTDSVFAEVNLILCRNVLIYFNKELQNKVHRLFFDSLGNGGILCLGAKESLRFCDVSGEYTEFEKKQKIYKKKY